MIDTDTALETFRSGVSPASPAARAAGRERLLVAVAAPAAPRRLPRGRLVLAALLAGAIGAVALAVGTLTGDAPGVVERAEAALDVRDRILHVVVRIDDASGTTRQEGWVRTDGTVGHTVSRSGEPASDCVSSPTQLRCYDAAQNAVDVYRYFPDAVAQGERSDLPGYRADDPASLALALRSGYARPRGETTVAGRPVHAIELAVPRIDAEGAATPAFTDASPILYVDRESYLPVAQRFPDAGSTTVYDVYEFLPDDAASAPLLRLGAPADARVVVHPVGEGPQS